MKKNLWAFGCTLLLCHTALAQEKLPDYFFLGTLGKSTIRLHINRAFTAGDYAYTQIGKDLQLTGKKTGDTAFTWEEQTESSVKTGIFTGTLAASELSGLSGFSGMWKSPDGKTSLPFRLTVVDSARYANAPDITKVSARFITGKETLLAFESGDVNEDGLRDFVLVAEQPAKIKPENKTRVLLVVLRGANDVFTLAKRSTGAVMCSQCGGMLGDAFAGLEVRRGQFKVSHYGGSRTRWHNTFTFKYTIAEKTWRLAEAEEGSYDALADEASDKSKIYRFPKNFGEIDIENFDPETYRKK